MCSKFLIPIFLSISTVILAQDVPPPEAPDCFKLLMECYEEYFIEAPYSYEAVCQIKVKDKGCIPIPNCLAATHNCEQEMKEEGVKDYVKECLAEAKARGCYPGKDRCKVMFNLCIATYSIINPYSKDRVCELVLPENGCFRGNGGTGIFGRSARGRMYKWRPRQRIFW